MITFTRLIILHACVLLSASAAPRYISVLLANDGWVFSISAEGRLDAQYGSNFDDHMFLPDGTVDVALLRSLLKAKITSPGRGDGTQVALDGESETHPVTDGSLLRYLILNKMNKWKFNPGTDDKQIHELIRSLQEGREVKLP